MEPIIHLLLPTAALMLLKPAVSRRRILLLSPLTLAPDLDFFFGHGWLHNVFFLSFLAYAAYYLSGKDRELTFIAAFYWASHLVLDLQFIRLLYPIYEGFISIHAHLYINPSLSQSLPAYLFGKEVPEPVSASELFDYKVSARNLPASALYNEVASPLLTSFGLVTLIYAFFAVLACKREE
jgi:hypothetical protein